MRKHNENYKLNIFNEFKQLKEKMARINISGAFLFDLIESSSTCDHIVKKRRRRSRPTGLNSPNVDAGDWQRYLVLLRMLKLIYSLEDIRFLSEDSECGAELNEFHLLEILNFDQRYKAIVGQLDQFKTRPSRTKFENTSDCSSETKNYIQKQINSNLRELESYRNNVWPILENINQEISCLVGALSNNHETRTNPMGQNIPKPEFNFECMDNWEIKKRMVLLSQLYSKLIKFTIY